MSQHEKDQNLDQQVIDSFGHEWAAFDYAESETDEALDSQFLAYCTPIDLRQFNSKSSMAADFGAGSGRWASDYCLFSLWFMHLSQVMVLIKS